MTHVLSSRASQDDPLQGDRLDQGTESARGEGMQSDAPARHQLHRARLVSRLDVDAPLTIVHGPAGSGKTELLRSWRATETERRVVLIDFPIGARPLATQLAALRDEGPEHTVVVLDNLDDEPSAAIVKTLVSALRADSDLRVIASGRRAHSLEGHAHRARLRTSTVFARDLLASRAEAIDLARAWGHEAPTTNLDDVLEFTAGWLEPLRLMVLDGTVDSDAAVRWVENVILADVPRAEADAALRLAHVERVTAHSIAAALGTELSDLVDALVDRGVLHRALSATGELHLTMPPVIRAAVSKRAASLSEVEAVHATIARAAYVSDPHRFAPDVLEHARLGKAWELLSRFWVEHGSYATVQYPMETREAYRDLPDPVVRGSITLAIAAALTTIGTSDDTVVDRLGFYGYGHTSAADTDRADTADSYLEAAIVRITQLRREDRLRDALDLGAEVQQQLIAREKNDHDRPSAINSALFLIQLAICRMLSDTERAPSVELAERALDYARVTRIDTLVSGVGEYLEILRATNGWNLSSDHAGSARAGARESLPSGGLGGDLALAMVGVDSLDRDAAGAALERATAHPGAKEIWPFIWLATGRYSLFFETPDQMDDRYRRLVWAHGGARDRPGTGRMVLDAFAVLADLHAGRVTQAKRRVADAHDESDWMLSLAARTNLSALEYSAALKVGLQALDKDSLGNRERAQILFITAASALALKRTEHAHQLFSRARTLADKHGLYSTYLMISHAQRAELLESTQTTLDAELARRLNRCADVYIAAVPDVTLTTREAEILQALARGRSHRHISDELFISVATVRSHIRTLYAKLHASDSVSAIAHARDLGLL
jgi:DNA-binding CsgD family transcriptional regulator